MSQSWILKGYTERKYNLEKLRVNYTWIREHGGLNGYYYHILLKAKKKPQHYGYVN